MWLGPRVWPELRKTVMRMRELQPDVMLRDRGIGNYGDYYTPERVVPGSKEDSEKPWFTIYPLGTDFSYDPDAAKYKGTQWIVRNLADTVAKGGGLQSASAQRSRRVPSRGDPADEGCRRMAEGEWRSNLWTRPREGALGPKAKRSGYTRSKDRRLVYAILTEWPGTQVALKSVRPRPARRSLYWARTQSCPGDFDPAQGTTILYRRTCNNR